MTDWDKKHTGRAVVECDRTTISFLQTATPHCCLLSLSTLNTLLVKLPFLKGSSPDIKYSLGSFILILILSFGADFHTLSACMCSLYVLLYSEFLQPSSFWRRQCFLACRCSPDLLFLLHFFLYIVLPPHFLFFFLSKLIWIVNWWPFHILMLLKVHCHSLFLHTICECQVKSRLFRTQNHKCMCSPMHLYVNPFVILILYILCLTFWKIVPKLIIKMYHFQTKLYLKLYCCKDTVIIYCSLRWHFNFLHLPTNSAKPIDSWLICGKSSYSFKIWHAFRFSFCLQTIIQGTCDKEGV